MTEVAEAPVSSRNRKQKRIEEDDFITVKTSNCNDS